MSKSYNFPVLFVIFAFSLLFSMIGTQSAYSQCGVLCTKGQREASAWNKGIFNENDYGLTLGSSSEIALESSDSYKNSMGENKNNASADDFSTDTTNFNLNSNEWQFAITPYLWMMGLNGKAGVKGLTADLDVSFLDLLENLDFGVQVHMEAWKGKYGFFVDTTYSKISLKGDATLRSDRSINIKDVTEFFLGEFAGFYRLGTWPLGNSSDSYKSKTNTSVTFDLIGGGRLWWMENTIDIKGPLGIVNPQVSGSKTWFDFMLGGRAIVDINKAFISLRSDIGGFNLGFSSDISWNIEANVGYELPWYKLTPIIGFRALYDKYDDGSGDNRFLWDAWMYGPQVGLAIRF